MSFCTALTILFIALKLCGVIAWSWWVVLSPLIMVLVIGLCGAAGIVYFHIKGK